MPCTRPAPRGWRVLAALAALALTASAAYTVRSGDTLSEIAARHGTTVTALAAANDLADPDRIRAGETLVLPGVAGGAIGGATGSGASGGAEVVAGSGGAATSPASVEALIEQISREHGWNPAFVKAVAWQESGWNNAAVSHAGALGIMQVMPETGERVSRSYGRPLDLADPADNIRAGVLFLDELHHLTGGDVELTLAGYFQGLGNVRRHGLYTATERYIDNVLALRERYR